MRTPPASYWIPFVLGAAIGVAVLVTVLILLGAL